MPTNSECSYIVNVACKSLTSLLGTPNRIIITTHKFESIGTMERDKMYIENSKFEKERSTNAE